MLTITSPAMTTGLLIMRGDPFHRVDSFGLELTEAVIKVSRTFSTLSFPQGMGFGGGG